MTKETDDRDQQIGVLLDKGKTNQEIAEVFGISAARVSQIRVRLRTAVQLPVKLVPALRRFLTTLAGIDQEQVEAIRQAILPAAGPKRTYKTRGRVVKKAAPAKKRQAARKKA